jgi:hypothetical protein
VLCMYTVWYNGDVVDVVYLKSTEVDLRSFAPKTCIDHVCYSL